MTDRLDPPPALPVYLKGTSHPQVAQYLTERGLRMHFGWAKKAYYSFVRPITPISARQWLQHRVNAAVTCLPNFIWSELVDLLKHDDAVWNAVTADLYPEGYHSAVVLTHDVETQAGFDFIPHVMAIEAKHGFRSSWNLVAHKYHLHQHITDFIQASGHEIGIHGYNHDGTLYYSRDRFMYRAEFINAALKKYAAVGFRSPQVHRDLGWLQALEVAYDASCFDYDPYQPFPGGTGCIWPFMAGRFVELPYTLPQDHTLFHVLGVQDISIWKEKSRWLHGNRGTILSLTHPDYLMQPGRLELYEELLVFLNTLDRSWKCLPRELAARYLALPDPAASQRQ